MLEYLYKALNAVGTMKSSLMVHKEQPSTLIEICTSCSDYGNQRIISDRSRIKTMTKASLLTIYSYTKN